MQKVSNTKDTYKPNDKVTVGVVNKRTEEFETGDVTYEQTVTVKIKVAKFATSPLTFDGAANLAEWMETINFDDPNETLALDDGEGK